jgi:predicted amidophosphoribosyltransferase
MQLHNLQLCPRCNRRVTSPHGLCSGCRENALQCRQCRNINYDDLHGFLCNECGYCKHARFSYTVVSRPSRAPPRIDDERAVSDASDNLMQCNSISCNVIQSHAM